MKTFATLHRRLFAAVLVAALAIAPTSLVAADTIEPPAISEEELSELVALVLAELGLPEDASGPIVDRLVGGVTERLNELVVQGIVDTDQVETVADLVEDGRFDEVVPEIVEQTRERRDAFREAAESVLVLLGVEVPEDGSIRDAIEEAGLTREDLADLLEESGIELPEPPARPDRDGCPAADEGCPERPTATTPRRAPAPTTTQAPAPTPPPTTTAAPAPPAPGYPEVDPAPRGNYPTRGGQDEPPPAGGYPTAGGHHGDAAAEGAL